LTPFQVKCIDECRVFLRDYLKLTDIAFQETVGKREAYFKTALSLAAHKFEIYIYIDEAGFMIDGHNWTICERPDYSNDEDLIKSFISKLQNAISSFQPAA
jgi:hypothetical protein